MRIVLLQDSYPPVDYAGAARVVSSLARAYQALGHEVSVLTTVRSKDEVGWTEVEGIKVYRIVSNYHERWRAYVCLYNPQTVGEVRTILSQLKPEVVHAHNVHGHLSYASLKVARELGAKVFLTSHDSQLFHYGKAYEFIRRDDLTVPTKFDYRVSVWQLIRRFRKRYNPFRNVLIRWALRSVRCVFAVSRALREAIVQNGIQPVEVVYNGIDMSLWDGDSSAVEAFRLKHDLKGKRVILFGGRLSELKGGHLLLRSLQSLVRQSPDIVLVVVGGDTGNGDETGKLAKELGILPNLRFTGWVTGSERVAAYHAADVVAIPSICLDSFPTMALEALACGKPVVGTCFGGLSELVEDGVQGFVVNPLDTERMAERLGRVLADPGLGRTLGSAGRERVMQFTVEQQAERYLAWFRR